MSRITILLGLVALLIPASARAADIYVNASAPGGGNGSLATPYNNIQAAVTQAAAAGADTIKIAGGTYIEGVRLSLPADTTLEGSYNATFTTRSTATLTSTISRTLGATSHGLLLVDGVSGVVIDGLVLENGHTQDGAGQDGRGGGLRAVGGVAVNVNNCIFRNCRAPGDPTGNTDAVFADDGAAVYSAGANASMTIRNSVFEDCFAENEGIVRSDDGILILEGCTFRGNDANSSMIRARNTSVTNLEVRNCLFYSNESTSGLVYANAATETIFEHNTVTSNTLRGGGDGIFHVENEAVSAISIQNNIFALNTTLAATPQNVLTTDPGLTGEVVTNNIFFSNNALAGPGLNVTLGSGGNIGGDPLFVDAANHDYHIQTGSAAQNAGVNVGVTVDFDGNPRIGIPDIGAFELPPPPNAARGWTLFD